MKRVIKRSQTIYLHKSIRRKKKFGVFFFRFLRKREDPKKMWWGHDIDKYWWKFFNIIFFFFFSFLLCYFNSRQMMMIIIFQSVFGYLLSLASTNSFNYIIISRFFLFFFLFCIFFVTWFIIHFLKWFNNPQTLKSHSLSASHPSFFRSAFKDERERDWKKGTSKLHLPNKNRTPLESRKFNYKIYKLKHTRIGNNRQANTIFNLHMFQLKINSCNAKCEMCRVLCTHEFKISNSKMKQHRRASIFRRLQFDPMQTIKIN